GEGGGPAELVVAAHPARGQVRAGGPHQAQADAPALLEGHVRGDVGLAAVPAVRGPLGRQVEAVADQGLAAPAGVGQEITDLAVVDLAQAAAPLAGHAAGVVPLLGHAVV